MSDAARSDDPPQRIVIRLLGAPRWDVPDAKEPTGDTLARKDAALIAKLALDGPQPRLALCELIWPHSTPVQAGNNLRQRASRLSVDADRPFFAVGATVALQPWVDVDVMHPDALADEVLLTTPGLLAGVDLGDHDELDRWLAKARTQVAERCAQVLADRAAALEQEGRLHEALVLARRIVEWLPLAEQGWRRVMRLHYLRGDRAAAQEAYWRLHTLLRDELGARPSAETQQLFQTVETAEATPALPRRPVPVSLLRPPVLVGRFAPWTAMTTAWQLPQPFVLVGEAGLGKSRLLEAFVLGQEGLVSERARPGDHESTDALLGRLLVQIEARFAPEASPALRAELARVRPEFGTPPDAPANVALLKHAVETWLAAAQARGLRAIVVDDLHNADVSSLDALRWMSASPALANLRLALASRPWGEAPSGAVLDAWLTDSHRPVRIALAPLTPAELAELLATLALPALVDAGVAAQLYRMAGGHPLYTLATLQHAVARGAELRDPQAIVAPDSMITLLDERIRGLPASARDLMQVAAVGGADLSVERAAQVLGCTTLALSDPWAVLEAGNVLRGEAFSHDLVHEAALRAVPQGLQQALHRQWAEMLRAEPSVPPARIASHWEAGLRWAEAGGAWHAAAAAARLAGRLAEQNDFFERAARCHAQAGDRGAGFEALLERLDGLQLRHGGSAVLDALPAAEALADTSLQRLRCRIVRTEALLEQGRIAEATVEAQQALERIPAHVEFAVTVQAQLAIALASGGRSEAALDSATQAIARARASGAPAERLKAANALMFVHWSAGALADAIAAQREELAAAEALGDRAVAAASEGSLAALLASAGDVPGTYRHAVSARERQRDCGLAENSTQVILNHTVLGAAAAALGRFDEALESLERAVELAGPDAAADVRGKAMLTLASVWLTLGRADRVRSALEDLPKEIAPGPQMQSAWFMARAAELDGAAADGHWARFDRLAAAHPDLPFVQGVVFEASWRDPAPRALERLLQARGECLRRGLHGAARALRWRELVRHLDLPGASATEAALVCAQELEPHADEGLSAKCPPPEVWLALARAWERAGDRARHADCIERGRRWLAAALARMAPELRHAFGQRNPVNRLLLAAADAR